MRGWTSPIALEETANASKRPFPSIGTFLDGKFSPLIVSVFLLVSFSLYTFGKL